MSIPDHTTLILNARRKKLQFTVGSVVVPKRQPKEILVITDFGTYDFFKTSDYFCAQISRQGKLIFFEFKERELKAIEL